MYLYKQEAHWPHPSPEEQAQTNKQINFVQSYDYSKALIWSGENQTSPFL